MRRFIFGLVIVLLCITSSVAQTKRKHTSAGTAMKAGYYFTISMSKPCLYVDWRKDAIRWFRAKSIRAVYGGYEYIESSQPFATVKRFEIADGPSDNLLESDLYVGPFASDQAALSALETFPSVLARIMKERNNVRSDGGCDPADRKEKVYRTSGNSYEYGFILIKGYRLKPK